MTTHSDDSEASSAQVVHSDSSKQTKRYLQGAGTGTMVDADVVKKRRLLYPSLYKTDQEVIDALERYSVDILAQKTRAAVVKRIDVNDGSPASTGELGQQKMVVTRQVTFQKDVWGNTPPKEPKDPVDCPVCKKPVNTLRFASHLDKCLGIGTMSRSAAAGGTRSSSSSTSK